MLPFPMTGGGLYIGSGASTGGLASRLRHHTKAMTSDLESLIYDWNRDGRAARADYRAGELDDETLRDGLQSPPVRNPPLAGKERLLQLMGQRGLDSADIGLPRASPQARQ